MRERPTELLFKDGEHVPPLGADRQSSGLEPRSAAG